MKVHSHLPVPRMDYDEQADALYIEITHERIAYTASLPHDIQIDYDKNDNIIGIEVLWANTRPGCAKIRQEGRHPGADLIMDTNGTPFPADVI